MSAAVEEGPEDDGGERSCGRFEMLFGTYGSRNRTKAVRYLTKTRAGRSRRTIRIDSDRLRNIAAGGSRLTLLAAHVVVDSCKFYMTFRCHAGRSQDPGISEDRLSDRAMFSKNNARSSIRCGPRIETLLCLEDRKIARSQGPLTASRSHLFAVESDSLRLSLYNF
ncbi:hypothetical protein KM043_009977 [Ampulex compressa]|nr:hypothetical protein KM043_009977 [Ampulex compressa]